MSHRVSRPFFIGAGAAAAWSALLPSVARGAGGSDLPVTPCTITAAPTVAGDPRASFVGTAQGWTSAQMKRTVVEFYALPSKKRAGEAYLSAKIESSFDVPAGTKAVGVQLRYDGKVVPTKPPAPPNQVNSYPLGVTTKRAWQFPAKKAVTTKY